MGVSGGADPAREREDAARRELFAVLAHELRSPIGAILGFEELLSEGILGEMPPGSTDALGRIRGSARQLLDLVAGLSDLAANDGPGDGLTIEAVDGEALVAGVLLLIDPEAAGRATRLTRTDHCTLPELRTDPERLRRALQLALMAAIKATAAGSVSVHACTDTDSIRVRIDGTRLDPDRDDPDRSLYAPDRAHLSGAGLRIGMARSALLPLGGTLRLEPADAHTRIVLTLPLAVPRSTP